MNDNVENINTEDAPIKRSLDKDCEAGLLLANSINNCISK